ncbi:MAG: double-strand break repair protein AddB [Alphaproteobacteria bacterium]
MSLPVPAVFTIAPDLPFVDVLAAGILARVEREPLSLSRVTLLLPTRRACRSMSEAFVRQGGGRPMLLPRLMTLGDLDEDEPAFTETGAGLDLPPVVTSLRRRLLLARLIRAGQGGSLDQAVRLAEELGRLLDQVQTERLPFSRLADLVPAELARHWQVTLEFLTILTEHWPRVLAAEGAMDAAEHRDRLAMAHAAAWKAVPPSGPVFAAGSTGSVPATADLLQVVAYLPGGAVVLPGLDREMDDESWDILEESHPQFGMKRLLERLGVSRGEVRDWPAGGDLREGRADPARRRLVAEAMRPAATSHRWQSLGSLPPAAVAGLERVDCPGPREEALTIALRLRETVEHPGRTAALITPDRGLARRVAAELGRWGIVVDDSGGRSLGKTPPGVFLRLSARMVTERFAPIALLSACKHPLAAGGQDAGHFRRQVRLLERRLLRGARPAPGLAGLRRALASRRDLPEEERLVLEDWLARMEALASPLTEIVGEPEASLSALVKAHMVFAESLAATSSEPGPARLWRGEAGEMAARFAAELYEAVLDLPSVAPESYPSVLEALMAGQVVRPRHGDHPRLSILGPLEARLQQADLLVLGGLNEGTWPPAGVADPWMSRPMRASFGLPLPERRIGLAAHDFAQACCAPRVMLTRAVRVEGTPTVPSRWLLRLGAVLRAAGLGEGALDDNGETRRWLDWAQALDQPEAFTPVAPPAPCPPVSERPRQLSVTEIETWMRDPYAIYARHVLKLRALEPLEADPSYADFGTLMHRVLERFFQEVPDPMAEEAALTGFLAIGSQEFAEMLARPAVWAFWWPRLERIARWVVATERDRRPGVIVTHAEVRGWLEIAAAGGTFRLTAKADRIDEMRDGTLAILDYKTGSPPSAKEVAAGYAPQLPLEAAMAMRGGFGPKVVTRPVSELSYWRLSGGGSGGQVRPAGKDPSQLAEEAHAGLVALIDVFDDPATPYVARPHPAMAPAYSDYGHLARIKEWATSGDGEEGGAERE